MDIFGILTMIGGLALFLYGMETMGNGLVMLSGGKLEKILEKLTEKRIMALLLGAFVTAVIQSSSATTVMVVGFVNSGIMKLAQAVGVIMGANIGTTITSWILSLTGIASGNVFIRLLKPSSFSPVLAVIGIILVMMAKEGTKKKTVGTILIGFAVLMFGMETMSGAVAPLKDNAAFTGMLTAFSNPILGMIAGAVLTAVIQSSSASVGILQALCISGAVGYGTAIPIIMGQNIGTCITAMISSIGASKNARRAAFIHLYFNLIGTILFMVVFYTLNHFVAFPFMNDTANAAGIAVTHSLFNIGCAIVLFPFANGLVKLATWTVRDKGETTTENTEPAVLVALDERFLDTQAFALQLSKNAMDEMARLSKQGKGEVVALSLAISDIMNLAADAFVNNDTDSAINVEPLEEVIDDLVLEMKQRHIERLKKGECSMEKGIILEDILTNYERVSDHCSNIVVTLIEIPSDVFDMHEYLDVKIKGKDPHFRDEYLRLKHIYLLP